MQKFVYFLYTKWTESSYVRSSITSIRIREIGVAVLQNNSSNIVQKVRFLVSLNSIANALIAYS